MIANKKLSKKDFMFAVPARNTRDKESLQGVFKSKKMNKVEDEDNELSELFGKVVKEIEERQKYLEDISAFKKPELKARIKKEIIERVAELEKINKLLNK